MPYPAHPTTDAQHAKAEYLTAKARFDANKNILKAGALKKAVETAGKVFSDQIETDVAGIRHNAVEHFQRIDHWLGLAAALVSGAKEAHERWADTHAEHDAETVVNAAGQCEHLAELASTDAREFGESWFAHRTFNCGEVDQKYIGKYHAQRLAIMEESKPVVMKVARIATLYHEALALRNLQLSLQHADDRVIMEKQGAAAEMFRSLEHMYATNFLGQKTVQNAAQNCETIRDWSHNPRLKKDGDLKQIDSIFINLSNLRKGYVQGLDSMQKVYTTSAKQFVGEDLNDPEIKQELEKSRSLIADTRQKFQFVENGYKNAMSDMSRIRATLKK